MRLLISEMLYELQMYTLFRVTPLMEGFATRNFYLDFILLHVFLWRYVLTNYFPRNTGFDAYLKIKEKKLKFFLKLLKFYWTHSN